VPAGLQLGHHLPADPPGRAVPADPACPADPPAPPGLRDRVTIVETPFATATPIATLASVFTRLMTVPPSARPLRPDGAF
jgi:hypothetical protein